MARTLPRLSVLALLGLLACGGNEVGFVRAKVTGPLPGAPAPRRPWAEDPRAKCGQADLRGTEVLHRAPYVQGATSDRANVLWTGARARLVFGAPGEPEREARVVSEGELYRAELRALSAGRLYCYRLVSDSGVVFAAGFRTAPTDTARLIVFGDMGDKTSDQAAVRDQLLTVPFDAALLTGDIAYCCGELAQYEKNFFAVYRRMLAGMAFFPTPGNHDYKDGDLEAYRSVFHLPGNERYYSFQWGPVHAVALDTEKLTDEQLAWLERDLAAADKPWKLVYGHHPPYSSGNHGDNERVKQRVVPILRQYGVQIAFFGHEHSYERLRPIDGIHYVVTGGGGRGTRKINPTKRSARAERVAHFVFVDADAQHLRLHAIDATGQEFDRLLLRVTD